MEEMILPNTGIEDEVPHFTQLLDQKQLTDTGMRQQVYLGGFSMNIVGACVNNDNKPVVFKCWPLSYLQFVRFDSGQKRDDPLEELKIMQELSRHPHVNVSRYIGSFIRENALVMAMDYQKGADLADFLAEKGPDSPLPMTKVSSIMLQTLRAVEHVHSVGYYIRDLALENIIYNEAEELVTIIDFGLAAPLDLDDKLSLMPYDGAFGRPYYQTPEVANARAHAGPPLDSWALGIVLLLLLTNTFPCDKKYLKLLMDNAYNAPLGEQLLDRLISASQFRLMSNDPGVESAFELVRQLVRIDARSRLSPKAAQQSPFVSLRRSAPVVALSHSHSHSHVAKEGATAFSLGRNCARKSRRQNTKRRLE